MLDDTTTTSCYPQLTLVFALFCSSQRQYASMYLRKNELRTYSSVLSSTRIDYFSSSLARLKVQWSVEELLLHFSPSLWPNKPLMLDIDVRQHLWSHWSSLVSVYVYTCLQELRAGETLHVLDRVTRRRTLVGSMHLGIGPLYCSWATRTQRQPSWSTVNVEL
jgi:hypothetical protein